MELVGGYQIGDVDSEADFAWENNMFLKYKGEPNDIFQKAEAGNISLNLPSTKFVSVGSGKSEGLFGLKAEYKLGPLAIQTILSREQVTKASQSISGGETSESSEIKDYNFLKDGSDNSKPLIRLIFSDYGNAIF